MTNRKRSLRNFAILVVAICLGLVIVLLVPGAGTWLPSLAGEEPHLGAPAVATQGQILAPEASPVGVTSPFAENLRSSPQAQCRVLVCSANEKKSDFVVIAEHVAATNESGVLVGMPPRGQYSSLPGLHVICLRPALAPALLQWNVDVLQVPAAEDAALARITVVDQHGIPAGGVRVAAAPVGRFVLKNDCYLWSAVSGDDGKLDIADLPVSPRIELRIVSGAVGELARVYSAAGSAISDHEAGARRQQVPVHVGRKLRAKVHRKDSYNADLYVRDVFDGERHHGWRGPMHLVEDVCDLAAWQDSKSVEVGVYDPLLGYPVSLMRIDDLESVSAGGGLVSLDLPARSKLRICARGPFGPCLMYAIEAWDVSARWNSKGARLLGDYPDGCLVIHGVLTGHRGLNVIPLDIGIARSKDHVFTLDDKPHLLEVSLESSRHVVVHVVSEDGKPIVGAQVNALSHPIDAKAALHLRYAQSDAARRSGEADWGKPYRMGISKTDSEGVVAMRVDGDSFALLVHANGFVSEFIDGVHWPWQTVDVVMSSGGSMKVVGEWGGTEGLGLHLNLIDSPRPTREVLLTAGAKEVTIRGLCPGDWAVSLHCNDVDFMDLGLVRIVRNEEATLVIPKDGTGIRSVRGVAMDSVGRPLGKARMLWWPSGRWSTAPSTFNCVTETDGSFTVELPAAVGMEAQIQYFHEASDSFVRLYALPIGQSVEDAGAMAFHALDFGITLMHDGKPLVSAAVDVRVEKSASSSKMTADSAGLIHLTDDGHMPPYGLRVSVEGIGSAVVDPLMVVTKGLTTLELR